MKDIDHQRQPGAGSTPNRRSTTRRRVVAVGVAVPAAAALLLTPAQGAAAATGLDLQGCYLSVLQFDDDAERLRPYVPAAYTLSAPISILVTNGTPQAAEGAAFMTWAVSCDGVRVDGESVGAATIALVGVVIEKPDVELVGLEGPAGFDHYVIAASADNEKLAHALSKAGLPAKHSPGLTFERQTDALGTPSTTTTVPGPHGLTFAVPAPPVNDTVREHVHSNSFWYGPDPATAAELELSMWARDWFCSGSACGSASAPAGHELAAFLGSQHRADASFGADHVKIDTIAATVRAGAGRG